MQRYKDNLFIDNRRVRTLFFDHELYFLEKVAPDRPVIVLDQQFAGIAHTADHAFEARTVGPCIRMPLAEAVHLLHVPAAYSDMTLS